MSPLFGEYCYGPCCRPDDSILDKEKPKRLSYKVHETGDIIRVEVYDESKRIEIIYRKIEVIKK